MANDNGSDEEDEEEEEEEEDESGLYIYFMKGVLLFG